MRSKLSIILVCLFSFAGSMLAEPAFGIFHRVYAQMAFYLIPFPATNTAFNRNDGDRWADTVNVKNYGAACDGVTDDATAWNAAIVAAAAIVVPSEGAIAARLIGCQSGNSLVKTSLNFTMFNSFGSPSAFGLTVDFSGTCLIGQTNGQPVIDGLGSRFINWDHLCIIGSATRTPSIGMQIGKTQNRSASVNNFIAPVIQGQFTFAAFYNFASEDNSFLHPYFANSYAGGTAYALVEDGYNHFNITSQFVTETQPVDAQNSFNENVFIGGTFESATTPFWFGCIGRHRFIEGYAASLSGTTGAILYTESTGNISQLYMDVHFETTSLTDIFLVSGPKASPALTGFTYIDHFPEASNSLFKLDTGVTSASMNDGQIHIAAFEGGNTVKVFDAPSAWSFSGNVYVPNVGNWTVPATLHGSVNINGAIQAAPSSIQSSVMVSGTPTTYGCTAGANCYDDNHINITSDTQTAGSSTVGPSALGINHVMGAGFTGAATGISNYFSIAGTSGNTSEDYVGDLNIATSNVADNLGALFGGNDNVFLSNGATGWHQLIGREIDVAAKTGSSVQDKYALQLVATASDAVFGSHANILLTLNSAVSPLGADCGICFGNYAGYFPFNANSTIIGGWPHATARNGSGGSVPSGAVGTTLNGVDFSAITFTGNAFASNAFSVDGSGNETAASYKVGATAGVSCSGTPTSSFVSVNGIVTHC